MIGNPPREADCFQQRNEGNRLADVLAFTESPTSGCLLIGPGGVGKSQIAAHFARNALALRSVNVVVWVSASSRESVQSSYAEAIHAITGADSSDTESAASQFLAWAHTAELNWLIVLDDLPAASVLKGLWPPSGANGKILVTTRRRDAALSGARFLRIPVGIFNASESLQYLTEKLSADGRTVDANELAKLAEDLDHLPLALAQSAAYLIDSNIDCSQYRELLADRRRSLSHLLPDADSLPDDHSDIVTATWSLSMEQADLLAPRGVARPLLQIAAVLNPHGCPRDVFLTDSVRDYVAIWMDGEGEERVSDGEIKAALRNLHRLSLIDDQHATNYDSEIRMHSLVQRAVVETMREEQYEQEVFVAAEALIEVWPDSSVQSDFVRALRSNVDFLRDNSMTLLLADYWHEVLYRYGESLMEAGLSSAAVEYFRELRSIAEGIDPGRSDIFSIRLSLGNALEEVGRISEALKEYKMLLADEMNREGSDEEDVLHVRSVLAECIGRSGDAQGAVRAFEDLLRDRIRIQGADHDRTFDTRRRLVSARSHAGDAAGAIATCQELLEDDIRVHGPDHPDTRHTQMHLADEIGDAGDAAGAIKILETLLLAVTRAHGEHHEETFSVRHHLARWYAEDKQYAKAIEMLRALLDDEKEALGDGHPDVLDLQSHLADYVGASGDAERALEIALSILESNLSTRGPEHPDTLDARGLAAHWKGRSGNPHAAAQEYEELLSDCELILGPDHPMTVSMVMLLASWLRTNGDMQGALRSYRRLVTDRDRIHGLNDVRVLQARDYLAYHMLVMGDEKGALAAFKDLHAHQVRLLGEDHPDTIHTREHIEDIEN
ncbi:tetratricopeptide repeat protein [Streptomyces sp. NPDC004129]